MGLQFLTKKQRRIRRDLMAAKAAAAELDRQRCLLEGAAWRRAVAAGNAATAAANEEMFAAFEREAALRRKAEDYGIAQRSAKYGIKLHFDTDGAFFEDDVYGCIVRFEPDADVRITAPKPMTIEEVSLAVHEVLPMNRWQVDGAQGHFVATAV